MDQDLCWKAFYELPLEQQKDIVYSFCCVIAGHIVRGWVREHDNNSVKE